MTNTVKTQVGYKVIPKPQEACGRCQSTRAGAGLPLCEKGHMEAQNNERLAGLEVPEHIAVIMDGNGRWAAAHGVARAMGHKAGCETLEEILEDCARIGVGYLTVYAFSTENWKRSREEVDALMGLFRAYVPRILKKAKDNNIRIRMIGDKSRFAPDLQEAIDRLTRETADNDLMTFTFAVNYGGRDEIRRAVQRMLDEARGSSCRVQAGGDVDGRGAAWDGNDGADAVAGIPERITDADIERHLDTAGLPDPDLLIRTSGELRISNFLLWQIAYSEIYVTDTLWPDFHLHELEEAIIAYNKRNRRFGGR